MGNSTSTGGAINVTNTNNNGAGLVVYSNAGIGATGHLIVSRVDNVNFGNSAIYATSAGNNHTALLLYTGTGTNAAALNVASTNQNFTALGLQVKKRLTELSKFLTRSLA